MKKLALLIVALLVVCIMACACKPAADDSSKSSAGGSSSTTTTQSSAGTKSDNGTSTQAPASVPQTSQGGNSTVTPPPAGSGNELNLSDAAAVAANTYFTLTADLTDKTSGGKTAKDGWLTGTVFTAYKQAGKCTTAQFGVKGISFTTTGAAKVYVYSTRGSSSSTYGDLVLINQAGTVIQTVQVTAELACYELTISEAGTYQVGSGSQASSVNIFAIKVA